MIKIYPELSAQATHFQPNPFVRLVLDYLFRHEEFKFDSSANLIDIGCGKLRHLKIYLEFVSNIFLVDTKYQIERKQKFSGELHTMEEYIKSHVSLKKKIQILTNEEFKEQETQSDIAFCVNVLDVVPLKIRKEIGNSAYKNLVKGGVFVVIVPRNDSSILKRCSEKNKFQDGHVFKRSKKDQFTFYKNFRNQKEIIKLYEKFGFSLIEDKSRYRQVCLIFQKQKLISA